MWLAKFANDASSMVHLCSSPWRIPCQPYGRLSIVVHYPSVSIRAAQSGLQSAPACRMQWVCHHLFRSYDRNPSNIANIRLYSVSGHTICCKDKLLFWNLQEKGRFFSIIKYHEPEYTIKKSFTILFFIRILETSGASQNRLSQSYHNNSYHSFSKDILYWKQNR